ncbi:uncharacterized protein CLUP02_13604 [Colletotrichum lupini]|uniref:Rapid response to glucose protein 1 n=1 Tax=Colletotrichum lupini TaxID=145971 RepID=A0A9Q8T4I6_9PEZI|nr:uncharacterized protein CLUP02_13604 [Colletotrichum lupini]UQC88082.1 hypothetical protein CLUP02_13604 [Colletotrichum lupini]
MILEPKDFPQMWQKPSSDDLLSTLKQLELSPPVWSHKRRRSDIIHEQEATAYFRREVTMYLSSIIKSGLSWIEDDDKKEEVWSEASRRMTERCGRTAMGEITRRWPFREEDLTPTFELIIREPPLTGDSLGLKTWGSSYVLAKHLPSIGSTALFRLFDESLGEPRPSILELGSGTGLLGLAAAALWKAHVILSDLPDIMSNLCHNVEANRATVEKLGGSLNAGALTWGGSGDEEVDQDFFGKRNQFKVVLAADPLYDDCHPGLLAGAFSEQLSIADDARAVVMVPLRDETTKKLLKAFRDAMGSQENPLLCIEEGTLDGQDDWGEDKEGTDVTCWCNQLYRPSQPVAVPRVQLTGGSFPQENLLPSSMYTCGPESLPLQKSLVLPSEKTRGSLSYGPFSSLPYFRSFSLLNFLTSKLPNFTQIFFLFSHTVPNNPTQAILSTIHGLSVCT